MEELLKFVGNEGFAIVVALYSLVRLETAIKANTKIITVLATKLGVGTDGN